MREVTRLKLERRRRDRIYKLVRLSRALRVPPWAGPNGVKPLHWDEWWDSVASVILVGHRTRSTQTVGDSKDQRLEKALKKSRRVVQNKVRDRLLLWEKFLTLLAELREGEFISCYCQDNTGIVCLTILDFPTIFIGAKVLIRVAPQLLPGDVGLGTIRKRFLDKSTWKACRARKRERQENPPRFKRWMEKLPRYLDETWVEEESAEAAP